MSTLQLELILFLQTPKAVLEVDLSRDQEDWYYLRENIYNIITLRLIIDRILYFSFNAC